MACHYITGVCASTSATPPSQLDTQESLVLQLFEVPELCGIECKSVSHVLWECPTYNISRTDLLELQEKL